MIFTWPFFAAVGFALLDWYAAWKENRALLLIAKPATLILIILWSLTVSGWQGGMLWFGIGLLFSLGGDVALLFPPRYFMAGLGLFLVAHVAFIIGFNLQMAPFTMYSTMIAVMVGITSARLLRVIRAGIAKMPSSKKLTAAALAYGVTLSLMLLSALLTFFNPVWKTTDTVFASIGASFFFISDSSLAYDRFVKKIPHGRFWVHITYHLGILGIITGALLHFAK